MNGRIGQLDPALRHHPRIVKPKGEVFSRAPFRHRHIDPVFQRKGMIERNLQIPNPVGPYRSNPRADQFIGNAHRMQVEGNLGLVEIQIRVISLDIDVNKTGLLYLLLEDL